MQNGIIKEFENNPDVVALVFNQGGANGETLAWTETIWNNYFLRGKIIWDQTGTTGQSTYAQPNTGLPFGRWFVIDQQGIIAAADFGYDPGKATRIIYSLLNKPAVGACHDLSDGTQVSLSGKTVTAGTAQIGSAFYVEEPDLSGGIRVDWPSGPAIPSDIVVNVVGKLGAASSGERQILASSVTQGTASSVGPAAMTNLALGGSSPGEDTSGITGSDYLYNIGMLVTIWGKVTEVGSGCFWMDDGSAITSDTGHLGVRVATGSLAMPSGFGNDAYVTASGISSCTKLAGNVLVRTVLARTTSDVTVIVPKP